VPDDHRDPSTVLATIQPAFTESERLAVAGFLAGYRGLTREDYTLDLRQFTAWCRRATALDRNEVGAPPRCRGPGAARRARP
jgi:hypothetical protein